jgi:hypothetical protein
MILASKDLPFRAKGYSLTVRVEIASRFFAFPIIFCGSINEQSAAMSWTAMPNDLKIVVSFASDGTLPASVSPISG